MCLHSSDPIARPLGLPESTESDQNPSVLTVKRDVKSMVRECLHKRGRGEEERCVGGWITTICLIANRLDSFLYNFAVVSTCSGEHGAVKRDGADHLEITQMWRLSANPGPCAPKSGALATSPNTVLLDFKFLVCFYGPLTMSAYVTILPYLILGLLGNCSFHYLPLGTSIHDVNYMPASQPP